ncbi:MAG: methylase N-4/N-6 domain protein [candidate division TM6 bacterium GW2011_GWF2_33_332]|nr:MAG: methylase N-4/N-6 domain protein [candidate division TM6 bacterium GW2011_GWF2_33_332]
MATGLPKTRWNGEINKPTKSGENVFELTWQEKSSSPNRLFYGDNIDVLRLINNDSAVKGKVKLIYIDPPYSTNSIFQTRDLSNGYADILKGKDYLIFLKERLILLRELLADDGSIYVHLDDNMAFHVKVLMDEIFGVNNFKNFIIRQKCRPKNFTKNSFGNIADYILFYTKTNKATWNKVYEEWSKEKILKEYPYIDEKTGRRHKRVPVHAPGTRNGETGKTWRGVLPPQGKHWQYTPAKLEQLDKEGKIYWSKNENPRRKVFLDESKGIAIQDIWADFIDTANQNTKITGYPTEKNPELLKRIIKASSNEGDYVLDCFAGSGTTLVAASELKRKWIGVDNETVAIETILKRFANGTAKMGDYVSKEVIKQDSLFLSTEHFISNFSLYSDTKKAKSLNGTLKLWDSWLKKSLCA